MNVLVCVLVSAPCRCTFLVMMVGLVIAVVSLPGFKVIKPHETSHGRISHNDKPTSYTSPVYMTDSLIRSIGDTVEHADHRTRETDSLGTVEHAQNT